MIDFDDIKFGDLVLVETEVGVKRIGHYHGRVMKMEAPEGWEPATEEEEGLFYAPVDYSPDYDGNKCSIYFPGDVWNRSRYEHIDYKYVTKIGDGSKYGKEDIDCTPIP